MNTDTESDVITNNFGSVVSLTPMTPAARQWINENCHTEPWQWLRATLNIDSRFAADLIQGMVDDGLTVR